MSSYVVYLEVLCCLYSGAIALHRAFFGPGKGLILLDDVQCTGDESSLLDCSHRGIYIHNCGHQEDVGILCQGQKLDNQVIVSTVSVHCCKHILSCDFSCIQHKR